MMKSHLRIRDFFYFSFETAKEFIFSVGGIAGSGYAFRLAAQQASKFLNVFWPGAGSVVSSGIATFGTNCIGKAAISYYTDEKMLEEVKKRFEEDKKKEVESNIFLLQ